MEFIYFYIFILSNTISLIFDIDLNSEFSLEFVSLNICSYTLYRIIVFFMQFTLLVSDIFLLTDLIIVFSIVFSKFLFNIFAYNSVLLHLSLLIFTLFIIDFNSVILFFRSFIIFVFSSITDFICSSNSFLM